MPIILRIVFAALGLIAGAITGAVLVVACIQLDKQDFDAPVMGIVIILLLGISAVVGAIVGLICGLFLAPVWWQRRLDRQS